MYKINICHTIINKEKGEIILSNILKICLIVCIWLVGNLIISKTFKYIINKKCGIHINFLGSAAKLVWAILMLSLITDMFEMTKSFSKTLLTSSGLIVAVAGFAAQQVLADIISGIMLSWAKPFDVGEKVTIPDLGISGIIESMSLRHTVIRTYHNSRLIVPNSVINKSVIENSNYDNHYIGNYLEIPISYESNVYTAISLMEEIIASHEKVLDIRNNKEVGKKVSVYIKDMTEEGVILKCTIWTKDVDDNFIACSDIRKEIKKQFDEKGIKICYKRVKVVN